MDYNTYPGCETMWPQHQHPMICLPGQNHSFPSQDEYWTPWDQILPPQEQKNYSFQPQMSIMSTNLIRATSPQEMHQSYDYDRSARYVSPTISHYSSSISESSASTDHALTPNTTHQSTPFFSNTAPFPGQHTFRVSTVPLPQHTLWQPHNPNSYTVFHQQSNLHTFAPSRSHSLDELAMVPHDDGDMPMIFGNEVDNVHSKSPMQAPQPEELELSEDQDDSTMSSVTDNDRATTSSRNSYHTNASDEETEEDEDIITVDHESDSDYENRPTRRRTSRTTPRQRHSRKSSSNTVISPNSRIHKRTSSSSTVIPSTPTSTPRSHTRRHSKTSRPNKPKGPTFPVAKAIATLPKTERTYPCTFHRFGCTVEFPNKNEWKRHVACQHLQLGYFRCDLDGCNPDSTPSSSNSSSRSRRNTPRTHSQTESGSPDEIIKIYNDFNRKDLFTQHCRRMHGPTRNPALCSKPPSKKTGLLTPTAEDEAAFETQLTDIRARCWHVRRPAPSRSSCGFCKKVFDAEYYINYNSSGTTSTGHGKDMEANAEEKAWEERMEHVGRHYEKEGHDREEEEIDEDLVEWGVRTGVLRVLADGRPWLVSVEEPVEGDANAGEGTMSENGSASGSGTGSSRGRVSSGSGAEEEKERKKARRQPSRTVVREKRITLEEEGDTIVIGVSLE